MKHMCTSAPSQDIRARNPSGVLCPSCIRIARSDESFTKNAFLDHGEIFMMSSRLSFVSSHPSRRCSTRTSCQEAVYDRNKNIQQRYQRYPEREPPCGMKNCKAAPSVSHLFRSTQCPYSRHEWAYFSENIVDSRISSLPCVSILQGSANTHRLFPFNADWDDKK